MIYAAVTTFARALSDHLKLSYELSQDIVSVCSVGNREEMSVSNKMIISLINIERETASGISFNHKRESASQFKKTSPAWSINLYLLVAAFFSEKQYEEGLQLLSGSLLFIQTHNLVDLPGSSASFAIEPVNLSFNELSNVWSMCGNTYHPSILCKLRVLYVDSGEIKTLGPLIQKTERGE